jgi:uncharacterized protein YcbK (DUF882 family)
MLSLPKNRSSLRPIAVLAAGLLLPATLPSQAFAEDRLSLVMPRDGEMTGAPQGGHEDAFLPKEPFESSFGTDGSNANRVNVQLERADNHETLTMDLPLDGQLGPDDAQAVAHFLRCRRTGRERPIDQGVLALLADLAAEWPHRTLEIISGFRAPPYGAPHSKHFKGQAIDLRIPGVRTTALRDYVWRQNRGVGVGYYQKENFVHMDSRPEAQERAWSGSQEGGPEQLNPRWARRARRLPPIPRAAPEAPPLPYAFAPATSRGTL